MGEGVFHDLEKEYSDSGIQEIVHSPFPPSHTGETYRLFFIISYRRKGFPP